jgi:hypothetical protein
MARLYTHVSRSSFCGEVCGGGGKDGCECEWAWVGVVGGVLWVFVGGFSGSCGGNVELLQ